MARKQLDEFPETRRSTESARRDYLQRDIAINAILSAMVGVLALAIVPPAGVEWSMAMQVGVATFTALVIFAFASALSVIPRIAWNG